MVPCGIQRESWGQLACAEEKNTTIQKVSLCAQRTNEVTLNTNGSGVTFFWPGQQGRLPGREDFWGGP